MLALSAYQDGECPCGCGGRSAETLDPSTDGKWHVGVPMRCYRKTAIAIRAAQYRDTPQSDALLFRAELT